MDLSIINFSNKLFPKSHIVNEERYFKEKLVLNFIHNNFIVKEQNNKYTSTIYKSSEHLAFYDKTDLELSDPLSILILKKKCLLVFGFEPEFIENLIKYYLKYRYGLSDEQINNMYNIFRLSRELEQWHNDIRTQITRTTDLIKRIQNDEFIILNDIA